MSILVGMIVSADVKNTDTGPVNCNYELKTVGRMLNICRSILMDGLRTLYTLSAILGTSVSKTVAVKVKLLLIMLGYSSM